MCAVSIAEKRIAGLVRRRFRFLLETLPEDTRQEIRLAALLYAQLEDRAFPRAVGRHFTAVATAYGYYRPRTRAGRVCGPYRRRELPSLELTCMEVCNETV